MNNEIALFPLPSIVLPEGKLSLRIFESRYIRMVTDAFKQQRQFGICIPEPDTVPLADRVYFGTLVEIVDFSKLDDGFLGIIVSGTQKFTAKHVRLETDSLLVASPDYLPNWTETTIDSGDLVVRKWLALCKQYPDLIAQHKGEPSSLTSWYCQRLLEVLPMEPELKKQLLLEPDAKQAYAFLKAALI